MRALLILPLLAVFASGCRYDPRYAVIGCNSAGKCPGELMSVESDGGCVCRRHPADAAAPSSERPRDGAVEAPAAAIDSAARPMDAAAPSIDAATDRSPDATIPQAPDAPADRPPDAPADAPPDAALDRAPDHAPDACPTSAACAGKPDGFRFCDRGTVRTCTTVSGCRMDVETAACPTERICDAADGEAVCCVVNDCYRNLVGGVGYVCVGQNLLHCRRDRSAATVEQRVCVNFVPELCPSRCTPSGCQ